LECPEVRVDEEVYRRHKVFLAVACVYGAECGKTLDRQLKAAEEEVRGRYSLEGLREDPRVKALRSFYWSMGIDPTKQRPASEALVRRVLRGASIPRINCAVDAGNIVSMETLIPIGIYDVAKLKPPLTLRYSRPGEAFKPIGRGELRLTGREIVLADEEKVVHIYPYRDGEATKVDADSRDLLVIAAGVPGLTEDEVVEAARRVVSLILSECGAEGFTGPVKKP